MPDMTFIKIVDYIYKDSGFAISVVSKKNIDMCI